MSDLTLTAYLMSMRGDDPETIAATLGVDVATVEAALERASQAQSGLLAQLRDAAPKERPVPPPSFTTSDGLVVRLETDLAAADRPGVWPLIMARRPPHRRGFRRADHRAGGRHEGPVHGGDPRRRRPD
jgi:hypothetical protein